MRPHNYSYSDNLYYMHDYSYSDNLYYMHDYSYSDNLYYMHILTVQMGHRWAFCLPTFVSSEIHLHSWITTAVKDMASQYTFYLAAS